MIQLGYVCVNTELPRPDRTCRLKNASPSRLLELSASNLEALMGILRWNAERGIVVFRISSDTIPFGSHPVNTTRWEKVLAGELREVGALIREPGFRVSMHPGQFTVLNSDRPQVVEDAVGELEYHGRLLEAFGLGSAAKIVLHIGGVYGDKAASLDRFVAGYDRLSTGVQRRIVIENDERSYDLADVLSLHERIGAPVVYDLFHGSIKPSLEDLSEREKVVRAGRTWSGEGRPQKIHYSDQAPNRTPGTHSESVDVEAFHRTVMRLDGLDLDIMLETKDKERSVLAARQGIPALLGKGRRPR